MKRSLVVLAGLAAIGYLVAMVLTGALPKNRQRVQFEARGILELQPERVSRVELTRGADRAVLLRRPGAGWAREEAGLLAPPLAERLSLAVQYMHTAGPVRVLEPAEFRGTDLREFGLDRPVLSIALHADAMPALQVRFGGRNPDDMLQYVAVEGRAEIFLLSRFVGQEWRAVADGVFAR